MGEEARPPDAASEQRGVFKWAQKQHHVAVAAVYRATTVGLSGWIFLGLFKIVVKST